MECFGPQCAEMLMEWLKTRAAVPAEANGQAGSAPRQGILWASAPYDEESPTIRTPAQFAGAIEHLEYAIHRRYENTLTRSERVRLDNTIRNALFKADRYVGALIGPERETDESRLAPLRAAAVEGRERAENLRRQARQAEKRLEQLGSLTPEGFEEFVAELFEALGFEVAVVGGSGDEGADLRVCRAGLRGVVQCKYHKSAGVIGSPDLQKFLGTIHHTSSHKGWFVTTRTFSLAAEKFAGKHPIELVDGPRLVELVREAIGPGATRAPEAPWF